ncbi:DUF262 domain-containing protein [Pedobacter jeongneungensis]|uniref:DUF262 domain-containing protein n=1 Tax=Pedobacter jeongneungensis TaxID=947309 RepID=UPI0004693DE1|nr:DUF262 domain-containing protein [Pedobacter jeongneungensis]
MKIEPFKIKTLLDGGTDYAIPIYQRNYAWGAKEIEQLIQDILDYAEQDSPNEYYIGILVVSHEEKNGQEFLNTIDGQQRLTTLYILSAVIRNEYAEVDMEWFKDTRLKYLSRTKSTRSLNSLFEGNISQSEDPKDAKDSFMLNAYQVCLEQLDKKTEERNITVRAFADYLYEYVKILRVPLSKGIDLNHYFEIMNSRGEQLEKHEILKATLMGCFKEQDNRDTLEASFDLIWEGCANMETYIQYGFSVQQRNIIFGAGWDRLSVSDFDEFVRQISPTLKTTDTDQEQSIDEILNATLSRTKPDQDHDIPDRFSTVVNFQNFLLHVLRVQTGNVEAALDDKRLIVIFDKFIPKEANARIVFVKKFIFDLLRSKLLFDRYIIKREFTANIDRWSLKSLHRTSSAHQTSYSNTFYDGNADPLASDNRRILMLLSMFHVSMPAMSYKYWLSAALSYLYHEFEVSSQHYISYLEHIAKGFVFDRYLASPNAGIQKGEYQQLIFESGARMLRNMAGINNEKMRYHQIENNLVFNFLDYLLWIELKDVETDPRVKNFEFTFRSSVEHYYPQTPINDEIEKLDPSLLHDFGNLCLISHEKNSRFSNYPPDTKAKQYTSTTPIDSIKQYLMMKHRNWGKKHILQHSEEMMIVFARHLNSLYRPSTAITHAQRLFAEYRVKNANLLSRALLCFGDCTHQIRGEKYSFSNFNLMRESEAFIQMEKFLDDNPHMGFQEIIDERMNDPEIMADFRYPMIKYPEVLNYASNGNFLWRDKGREVIMLRSEKRTTHQAKNTYSILIENFLTERLKVGLHGDKAYLYVRLDYSEGKYYAVERNVPFALELFIWINGSYSVNHFLKTNVNGHSRAVKSLWENKWLRGDDTLIYRMGKSELLLLKDNWANNINKIYSAITGLFKNGFGIQI